MSLLCLAMLATDAQAAGPWRGQIVDADTGQPLTGVVVLAFWTRSYPSFGGWAGTEYSASEETVTGPDGRFVIGSRWSYTIPLIVKVDGPEWRFFKPGYGKWAYGDPEKWEEFDRGIEIIITLRPAKTREERLAFLRAERTVLADIVPAERKTNLLRAVNEERERLGLSRESR